MGKRLQVVLEEGELREIQRVARSQRVTVAERVRQALRKARRRRATGDPEKKLAAVRAAVRHSFPTADIGQMLDEIEAGYAGATPSSRCSTP